MAKMATVSYRVDDLLNKISITRKEKGKKIATYKKEEKFTILKSSNDRSNFACLKPAYIYKQNPRLIFRFPKLF